MQHLPGVRILGENMPLPETHRPPCLGVDLNDCEEVRPLRFDTPNSDAYDPNVVQHLGDAPVSVAPCRTGTSRLKDRQ